MEHEPLFGRWLRKRRKTLDLTQKALAREVGCSPATIRKIEAELRRPSRAIARRLAEAVGIHDEERKAAFVAFARQGWRDQSLAEPAAEQQTLAPPWRPPDRELPVALPVDGSDADGALFVAREAELASLERHLRAAVSGRGVVTFVTGEPGSGKSALLAEFGRRAQRRYPGLLVVGGACNAYAGAGDPYLPFRDLMEGLTGDVERQRAVGSADGERIRRLAEASPLTVPALLEDGPDLIESFVATSSLTRRAERTAAQQGRSLAPSELLREVTSRARFELAQRQLFDQFAAVLIRISASHPLLLLLDDLQWADDGSIALLFHLARRMEGSRLLIVGAYRPTEVAQGRTKGGSKEAHPLEPVARELARYFGDIRVDLDRIAPEEGHRFVEALLDNEPNSLPERFRTALFQRTEGHPLFAVELLRDMQARGDLVLDEFGRWREGPRLDWQALPVRVEAVIAQRIASLDEPLLQILRVASVEGEEFTAQVVAKLLGADELAVTTALAQQLDKRHGLVREIEERHSVARGPARFRFSHALFQRYVYENLSAGEKRLIHGGVARALVEVYGETDDAIAVQLAHHYAQAGDDEQTLAYLVRAGLRAHRLAALDDAARLYQAALERWPRADQTGRARTLRQLAECLWLSGNLSDALSTCEKCRLAFESVGDWAAVGMIQRQIGRLYWEQGDRKRSFEHYRQALALLEQGIPNPELARAVSSISQMHMLGGEFEEAIEWGRRALALAEQLQDEGVRVHALCNLGVSEVTIGDKERGLAMVRESARRAEELGLSHDACRASFCLAEDLTWLCRYDEARQGLEELLAYARGMHVGIFIEAAEIRLAELDWLQGAWGSALERTQELAERWGPQRPEGHVELLASIWLAGHHNDLGLPRVAHDALEASLATARRSDEQQTSVPHTGERLRAAVKLANEDEASQAVQEILEWGERQRYLHPYRSALPFLFACQWSSSRSDHEQATRALRILERLDAQAGTAETSAVLSEALGLMALVENKGEGVGPEYRGSREGALARALDNFRNAAAKWEELGREFDLLRALNWFTGACQGPDAALELAPALERAMGIMEGLADQLSDHPQAKNSFLASSVVEELRGRYAGAEARSGSPFRLRGPVRS